MIEFLGVTGRAIFLLGALGTLGLSGFLLLAPVGASREVHQWRRAWYARIGLFWLLTVIGLAAQVLSQAMTLMGADLAVALNPAVLDPLLRRTNFGQVWIARALLMALLLILWAVTLAVKAGHRKGSVVITSVLAGAAALAGPFAGHSYGAESPKFLMSVNAVHILLAGLWAGGLPCWISWARLNAAEGTAEPNIVPVYRFSHLALASVVLLLLTGLLLADEFVEHLGDLIGTRYGLLIVAKVAFFSLALYLASRIRDPLSALKNEGREAVRRFYQRVIPAVRRENRAAALVVILAGVLAQTTPAVHDQPQWVLPFRVSLEAAWDAWPDALYGVVLAIIAALIVMALGMSKYRGIALSKSWIWLFLVMAVGSSAGAVYWLSVPAYPHTYLRSDVPYLAASVVQGQQLFQSHCAECHGTGGLGDGEYAASLAVPPADLSEPHTSLHTAGDMFWWFSHGIPESGMPGFSDQLSEQDRWDLVNFLRAFSQGFEARVLRDSIVPRDPWLGAPNFYFDSAAGYSELKALRESHTVLLVFTDYSDAESVRRLAVLSQRQPELTEAGLQMLIVPIQPEIDEPQLTALQFVRAEARPIWSTYSLLSRSFADRGDENTLGVRRSHVEFLVDRFGYLRARWIPGETSGWADVDKLLIQVKALMAEPEIEPPPDDHVH